MLNKVYEKTKYLIKNYFHLILLAIGIYLLITIQLPYYVEAPGGLINTVNKYESSEKQKTKGSLNMTYVSEYPGTIPVLLYALINPNWDIYKNETKLIGDESLETEEYRSKLLNSSSNNMALLVAYKYSGLDYEIINRKIYITYIDENVKTKLKIKDQILEINNKKIKKSDDIYSCLDTKKQGDILKIKVKRNNQIKTVKTELIEVNGLAKIGIGVSETFDIESEKKVKFKFKENETGSSSGLAMTLALYSFLTNENLTKNRVIAITGTIDEKGNVGKIAGIKYKLEGAIKNNAKIFIVPKENYKEALKYKKNKEIEIKAVNTFVEAIEYLKK